MKVLILSHGLHLFNVSVYLKYVVLRPVTKQNFLVLNLYNNVSQPYELWF